MRGRAVRHQTVVASQGQTVMRVPGRWPGLPLHYLGHHSCLPPTSIYPTPPLPCLQPPSHLQPSGAPLCTVFRVDRALSSGGELKASGAEPPHLCAPPLQEHPQGSFLAMESEPPHWLFWVLL